jgi:hypothetical protein
MTRQLKLARTSAEVSTAIQNWLSHSFRTAALEQSRGQYLALDQLVGDPEGAGDPARFPPNSGGDVWLTLPRRPRAGSLTGQHEDLASLQALHHACSNV